MFYLVGGCCWKLFADRLKIETSRHGIDARVPPCFLTFRPDFTAEILEITFSASHTGKRNAIICVAPPAGHQKMMLLNDWPPRTTSQLPCRDKADPVIWECHFYIRRSSNGVGMCPRQLNLRQPGEKPAPHGPAASGLTIEGAAATRMILNSN